LLYVDVKINQISVNGIAFSGTFEITKGNHHII